MGKPVFPFCSFSPRSASGPAFEYDPNIPVADFPLIALNSTYYGSSEDPERNSLASLAIMLFTLGLFYE
jgi:hypothetical protein